MEARKLLDALHVAEKLKDETRHCTTTKGAPENVASHSWRMALMAYFMTDEFPAPWPSDLPHPVSDKRRRKIWPRS